MPHILIVEDYPPYVFFLKEGLTHHRIDSDHVSNGLLAVKQIKAAADRYDGVIMDVNMPVMDGIEATQQIRALGFTKPIIGFSAADTSQDITRGLQAGMDRYLPKRIHIEALIKAFKEIWQQR